MKELDTIREALEMASKFFRSFMDGPREGQINDALAALSTIDPDAKPQEPSEDAAALVRGWWIEWMDPTGPDSLHEVCARKLVAIITAHDDAIRRECADRAITWQDKLCRQDEWANKNGCGKCTECDQLRSAILATEPAREKDGCFRCRNRPLPGASGELCKSCKLVIGKNYDPIPILATEPAREGS